MSYRLLVPLVFAFAAPLEVGFAGAAHATDKYRVSGPVTHDNLTIYFLHGPSAPGPVPMTLGEALAKGTVTVHETGSVNQLLVENTGSEDLFVQAGDIVKGGKQDRVLTVSLLIPGKSGKVPIGAFCVEQGRWAARGREDIYRFASAEKSVPSREAKMAMMAPPKPPAAQPAAPGAAASAGDPLLAQQRRGLGSEHSETASRQSEVWRSVGIVQDKLARSLNETIRAAPSASSLQLSLENQKLADTRALYVKALKDKGEAADDILGFVFAINGRLNSAEIYPSNGLFRKMWPKLLDASATEAIGERSGKSEPMPDPAAVLAFLEAAETGAKSEAKLDERLVREARDAAKAIYVETRHMSRGVVHRSYLAKH
jgi:hypothetical protein